MKALFDQLSYQCSKYTTQKYSTSFSLGILFLSSKLHNPIYNIYGFVRFADEIVDSFEGYDKKYLLNKFRLDTVDAIEQKISLNPILNSFQKVYHQYNIDWELVDTFLKSMEMDLSFTVYDQVDYDEYILGSAEVVGLMCLKVFTENNSELYDNLKPTAKKLGAAFQKVNFLRDAQADFEGLGRTYFPDVNMGSFTNKDKQSIELEISQDFNDALIGIKQLPKGSRKGVYLAYFYYMKLFKKIKKLPANRVLESRIRIPNPQKIGLMAQSLIRHRLNLL
ncbi:MAG: phytoene/squalene synthase family protein [Flavobacteriales bacterium]|jgi:phytoene synthase|tara:strand:- start:252 stop:1088 length:837 start_codon:yes stop_codon:yes gene_type:complete